MFWLCSDWCLCSLVCCLTTTCNWCYLSFSAAQGTTRCQTPPACSMATSGPCIRNTRKSWRQQMLTFVSIYILHSLFCMWLHFPVQRWKFLLLIKCFICCNYSAARWNQVKGTAVQLCLWRHPEQHPDISNKGTQIIRRSCSDTFLIKNVNFW